MNIRLVSILISILMVFSVPLSVSAEYDPSHPPTSLLLHIEITDDSMNKIWTAEDFAGSGITYVVEDQWTIQGIDGKEYRKMYVCTDTPAATMALLLNDFNVAYCEYDPNMWPSVHGIPSDDQEMGVNGEIFRKSEIVLLIEEDVYVRRTKDDFSFLTIDSCYSERNEALGVTWVQLRSTNWGQSQKTVDVAEKLWEIEGVVFCQPTIWGYSAYGKAAKGDVNFDGNLSTTDARELLLYVLKDNTIYLEVGDLNKNGILDTSDTRILLTSVVSQ